MVFPLNPIAHNSDRLTDDEFYAFCQANRVLRLERDETGQIWFRLLRYTKDSIFAASLIGELGIWNRLTKLGYVYDSNGGFTLPDTSVRARMCPGLVAHGGMPYQGMSRRNLLLYVLTL